ncbi:MAG: hypothetical protein LUB59_06305, partial [Candidatus Gastranaerophilales bacterium]|nr:hypothetical protein [Candidatus Gastranaerophilales bacterium]
MLVNNLLDFIHKNTGYIYENSTILKNIDKVIFVFILLTFIVSTFMNSDIIGYFALCTVMLTIVRIVFTPDDKLKCEIFEIFLLIFFMLSVVSTAGSTLL